MATLAKLKHGPFEMVWHASCLCGMIGLFLRCLFRIVIWRIAELVVA